MKRKQLIRVILLFLIATVLAGIYIFWDMSPEDMVEETVNMEGTGIEEKLSDLKTYKNWMTIIVEEREEYANDDHNGKYYPAGDPFIMKYNGKYYLYPSTHYGHTDVRAWSSDNLIDWSYEGIVAKDDRIKMAYAPEITYWNGYFYMVTSPGGDGHYVLRSESPTGPFTIQTENLGMKIDGSIFIDDDGQWYFFHSGVKGIRGREMENPFTFGIAKELKGTSMNGWTEGPGLIKRNGIYFMTQTGNHIMSKGYRINYSISKAGPLGSYTTPYNNPIIINTDDGFHGLGHNSTVLGPDLDSYYIVYHNNKNPVPGKGHDRHLNIDKLVFNGEKMDVLGPTNFSQKAPRRPDFYTWINDEGLTEHWNEGGINNASLITSKEKSQDSYTAEFNFKLDPGFENNQSAKIGAIFSFKDEHNFGMAVTRVNDKKMELVQFENGERTSYGSVKVPEEFDFTKLHTILVKKQKNKVRVYFDGMKKFNTEMKELESGSIGYIYEKVTPVLEYTAFSKDVNGSSDFDAYKPVPGSIESVHYLKGKGRGYHTKKPKEVENPIRADDDITIEKAQDNTYLAKLLNKGDWLQYNINVKEEATYGIDFRVKDQVEDAEIEVYVDNQLEGIITVPAAEKGDKFEWTKVKGLGDLQLVKDLHTLKLKLVKGQLSLLNFEIYAVETGEFQFTYDLSKGDLANGLLKNWSYIGNWSSTNRGHTSDPDDNAMAFTGETTWSDYTVEADITFNKAAALSDGGLLVRASNESEHKHQVTDSVMGYYISLTHSRIALKKLNYDVKLLEKVSMNLHEDKKYRIKVRMMGSQIQIYIDDMNNPVIEYTDTNAFTYGKVGIRSAKNAIFMFNNISIKGHAGQTQR